MATASFGTLFNVSCVVSEYQKSSRLKVYPDLSKLRKFSSVIFNYAEKGFIGHKDFSHFYSHHQGEKKIYHLLTK